MTIQRLAAPDDGPDGAKVAEAWIVQSQLFCSALESDPDPATRSSSARALAIAQSPEVTAVLRKALSDPVAEVRVEVLNALARGREPETQQAVASCLNDPEAAVRLAAAGALYGANPEVTLKLIAKIQDSAHEVRRKVLSVLIVSDLPEAREAVWHALSREVPGVQLEILKLVRKTPDPAALPYLKAAALSGDSALCAAAHRVAAQSSLPEAEQILIAGLGHQDATVRKEAVEGLAKRSTSAATEALIWAWRRWPGESETTAATIINSLAGRDDAEIVSVLAEALLRPQNQVMEAAIAALKSRPGVEAAHALLRAIPHLSRDTTSEDWMTVNPNEAEPVRVRSSRSFRYGLGSRSVAQKPAVKRVTALVRALAARKEKEVVDGLIDNLSDITPAVRCVSALSLAGHESEASVSALAQSLDRGPESVSRCAAWALARFEGDDSLGALISVLRRTGESFKPPSSPLSHGSSLTTALNEATQGLQRRPLAKTLPLLEEAYREGDSGVRRRIIQLVKANGNRALAVSLLLRAAQDTSSTVRLSAIDAIAMLSTDDALRALQTALDDSDPAVTAKAVSALRSHSHPAGRQILAQWLLQTTRGDWSAFNPGQLGAVKAALQEAISNAQDLATRQTHFDLVEKAASGRDLRQVAAMVGQMPPAWDLAAEFYPADAAPPAGDEMSGAADDNSTEAAKELAALPMALAAHKMSASSASQRFPLHDMFQGLAEEDIAARFTDLIHVQGRPLRPVLRDLLERRDTPERVRCGLCLALGRASDKDSAPRFVELLESPSESVRQSAMRALSDLGDAASPQLALALAARARNAQIVSKYLLTILDGNPPPALPDLVKQSVLEEDAESSEADIEGSRMSSADHMKELVWRLAIVFAGAASVGVVAALLAAVAGPSLLARLYGVSLATALAYIPPGRSFPEWSGLVAAAWFGCPLLLYEAWRFVAAGLYSVERTLAWRPVFTASALFAGLPIILFSISRSLPLMPFHLRDSVQLIWITDHSTLAIALLLGWIVGFKRIWTWLGLRMRTHYITGIFARIDTTQRRRRVNLQVLLIMLAISSVLVAPLVSPYVAACLFLGLTIGLALITAVFWLALGSGGVIDSAKWSPDTLRDSFRIGLFRALAPVPLIVVLVLLVLAFLPGYLRRVLELFHLSSMAGMVSTARIGPNIVSFFRFLSLGVWISLPTSIVWRQVVVLLRHLSNRASPDWGFHRGATAALLVVLMPAIVLSGSSSLSLAVLAAFGVFVLVLFASLVASGLAQLIRPCLPLVFVLAVSSQAPAPVLWGMLLWPLPLIILAVPLGTYLWFELRSELWSNTAEWMRRNNEEVKNELERQGRLS